MNEKPWLKNYPVEVPKKLLIDSKATLVDLFEGAFTKYRELPVMESMGKVIKYKDLDRLSQNFAAYVQNFTNLKPGDHIAIQLPNILQYPVAAIGFIRAGMVLVSLNPLFTPYEMSSMLKDANVKAIIILENFAHKLEQIVAKLNLETIITTEVGDMLGFAKKHLVNFTLKHIKKVVPRYNLPRTIKFSSVMNIGRKVAFTKTTIDSSRIAAIQYTGGTTGVSKGAMLSHTNIISNVEQMKVWLCNKLNEGKETIITAIPLYHIFAFTINLVTMIKLGAKNILVANPRDMKSFIKDLKKHRITCLTGVTTLFNALLANKEFFKIDFSKLKITISGGMSLNEAVANRWEAITGVPIIEAYGLTEASPGVIGNPFDGNHRLGTIGMPIPNTDAKIVDESGNILPSGTAGDLLVKGPQVMQGYWKNQAETDTVLRDGWLHTGDVAVMDQDGFIKIIDRKKDVINVSGFNVYPNEIEEVISMHPKVYEVAAIGIPQNEFREKIKVFVVRKDESLSAEDIMKHCKLHLTNYKLPKEIEFRSELPKSNLGKVLRRILKKEESQE